MLYALKILHFFKKGVGVIGVEIFVTRHYGYEIFRFRKIDDAVRPAWDHVNRLDFFAGNHKFHRLAGVNISLPNQAVSGNHDKQLPLGIVPVLSLCDPWAADVNGYLSAALRMQQLRK